MLLSISLPFIKLISGEFGTFQGLLGISRGLINLTLLRGVYEVHNDVNKYIRYYSINDTRLHATLGYQTSNEYENS